MITSAKTRLTGPVPVSQTAEVLRLAEPVGHGGTEGAGQDVGEPE